MRERARGIDRIADELHNWLEALRLAMGGTVAELWTVGRGGDALTLQLATPDELDVEMPETIPLQGHAIGWVVTEGVSLKASRSDVFHSGDGWLVAAPLSDVKGERVGCVVVEFEGTPRADAPRSLELAAGLAGRLISDARSAEGALQELARYEVLYEAIRDLDRQLDLDGLARTVCRRARRVAGAAGAVVAAWDPNTQSGEIVAIDGAVSPALMRARLRADGSFLGLALSNGTPLPRDDLRGKKKFPLYAEGIPPRAGSAIIMPMIVDVDPIGALAVEYDKPRQFSEGDANRLQALAQFVASSFRNAAEFGEVRALSLTDALTGLPNRRATERALASASAVAERTEGAFAVAVLDIDHFKRINDTHGHDAGDAVLRGISRVIHDSLRPGDHCGRWGGEEFLVVLPSTSLEDAARGIERIRLAVERSEFRWEARPLSVTVSAGVSAYPEVAAGATDALTSADAALYKAKRGGRNLVALADRRRGH